MVKDEFKGLVKEYNDESCSWCKSESNCFYKINKQKIYAR
ncbi:hypothetical protein BCM20_002925 [Clostridium beijerinckii]|nr:hypothetical protein [Clostridium beijerinckii]NYC02970.1 hypothetical protein [Clostridium beijerinckii]